MNEIVEVTINSLIFNNIQGGAKRKNHPSLNLPKKRRIQTESEGAEDEAVVRVEEIQDAPAPPTEAVPQSTPKNLCSSSTDLELTLNYAESADKVGVKEGIESDFLQSEYDFQGAEEIPRTSSAKKKDDPVQRNLLPLFGASEADEAQTPLSPVKKN